MMDITTVQLEHREWQEKNFPDSDATQALLGIQEEVGELAHAHLKSLQGIRGSQEEHQEAKRDALGDIFIYMVHYANKEGFSLSQIFQETWDQVKTRDWTKNKKDGKVNDEES